MAALCFTVRNTSVLPTRCLACFAIFVPRKGPSYWRGRPGALPYLEKQSPGSRHHATAPYHGQMASFSPCGGVPSWDTGLGLVDVGPVVPLALQCSLTLSRSLCCACFRTVCLFRQGGQMSDAFCLYSSSPSKTWISVESPMGSSKKQHIETQVLEGFPLRRSPGPS